MKLFIFLSVSFVILAQFTESIHKFFPNSHLNHVDHSNSHHTNLQHSNTPSHPSKTRSNQPLINFDPTQSPLPYFSSNLEQFLMKKNRRAVECSQPQIQNYHYEQHHSNSEFKFIMSIGSIERDMLMVEMM